MKKENQSIKPFLALWGTQSLSQMGSAMTGFALTLWLYEETGSALQTALLSVCTYVPYVAAGLAAGALSDRWDKKKTVLACDTLAACCSAAVWILLKTGNLMPWHLYLLNAVSGLLNTVQQPAGEVAMTRVTPRAQYQRVSGLRSLSASLIAILHPMAAAALYAAAGMDGVLCADLAAFAAAFLVLAFFVRLPEPEGEEAETGRMPDGVKAALSYLQSQPLLRGLMLFMAGVNLAASALDAALTPYVLSSARGGEAALGLVMACGGGATLAGSLVVTVMPEPKDRVRQIRRTALFSLTSECFLLALTRTPFWWCAAHTAGWIVVPAMNASLDVIVRSTVPDGMQGRIWACRNTLQFFTVPVGTFLGGFLVERVCEPLLASWQSPLAARLFGAGRGGGAALFLFLLGGAGGVFCLLAGRFLRRWEAP